MIFRRRISNALTPLNAGPEGNEQLQVVNIRLADINSLEP